MTALTLGQALEREHREIDGGIEAFVAALDGVDGTAATTADTAQLVAAFDGLRRHIYLEEEFLFPPLKAAGLMGPIFVMLREHGMLWKQMHAVSTLLADSADALTVRNSCIDLLALLSDHNSKEEPIIYTQADEILDASASGDLLAFLDTGTTPDGWVCSAA